MDSFMSTSQSGKPQILRSLDLSTHPLNKYLNNGFLNKDNFNQEMSGFSGNFRTFQSPKADSGGSVIVDNLINKIGSIWKSSQRFKRETTNLGKEANRKI